MNDNLFKVFSLILLAAAIALSPSFSFGSLPDGKAIEIRAEDILIMILGLIWIADFLISGRREIKKPPLLLPVLAWLGIGFASVLTNWILGKLKFERGFFYFLKEIEFFVLYFYVFYEIKNISSAKLIISSWFFLAALNVGYVVYYLLIGAPLRKYGEYGIGAICEWGVFPSGCFFLLFFIFLYNIFLYYFFNLNISKFKKLCLGFLSISPVVGAFSSGSKTIFLAVIFSFVLTAMLFFRKRNKLFKKVLATALSLFLMIIFLLLVMARVPVVNERVVKVSSPSGFISDVKRDRINFIKKNFKEIMNKKSFLLPVLGFGIGYVGEAHNQYLRNFIETGIIGSVIFLILIFVVIKTTWQAYLKNEDNLSIGLSAGFLTATLAMLFCSLATEPFIVVKPSEVYWFFGGITMAVLSLNKKAGY